MASQVRGYVRKKPYPKWKVDMINEIKELLTKYSTVVVFDLKGLKANVLQQYRRVLRGRGVVKVFKNNLMLLALRSVYGESLNPEVEKLLTGENGFIFTNENFYELHKFILENAVRRYARPGDRVESEIIVPAGNTGINPGPILSRFSKLKVPTQIRENKIWVARDTQVAKPGDIVSPELADLLRLLKVKPIYEALRVKAVIYKAKYIVSADELKLDYASYRSMIVDAISQALRLAVNSAAPTPEALTILLAKASVEALNLAVNAKLPLPEALRFVIAKASAEANALASVLASKGFNVAG